MKVLITGASGFVGSALATKLAPECSVIAALRAPGTDTAERVEYRTAPSLSAEADWSAALRGADVVVHLAARVHVMRDTSADPLAEFRSVNVHGTRALAAQAATAGVQRFVFLSSIKVNGERTEPGKPFRAAETPQPVDPYGVSKLEAEAALREVCGQSNMSFTIIRPPLVYGPGVKANFRAMMKWLHRGVPLPLGKVTANRRSLVALDNLLSLIRTCMTHPRAANRTFLVSDGEDLSTAALLTRLALALGRPARLLPVPPGALLALGRLLGRPAEAERLLLSLQADISDTCSALGWTPAVTVDEGLAAAARDYLARTNRRS